MRTLQEKYNGIQEGKFSKDQFLVEARQQLPNLVTRYNGYDDAVQILKNRGMIKEATSNTRKVGDKVSVYGTNNSTYLYSGEILSVDGDNVTVGKFSGARPSTGEKSITVPSSRVKSGKDLSVKEWSPYGSMAFSGEKEKEKETAPLSSLEVGDLVYIPGVSGDNITVKDKREDGTVGVGHPHNESISYQDGNKEVQVVKRVNLEEANLGHNEISSIHQEGDSWIVTYRKDGKKEKVFKTEKEARDFEKTLSEAKLTKKSLTDYRYKPTNDMDKYPYEQILRGLRVELETLGVKDVPTAEEYTKALSKVSKNLEKDSIFYTNLVAGVNPKVDLHDKLVPINQKELFKTSVATPSKADGNKDTFNDLKKAQLKEGFRKLIKKVLTEGIESVGDKVDPLDDPKDPLHDYMESIEPKEEEVENYKKAAEADTLDESPAKNNPKIEKLVDGINDLIAKAVDIDGDPIGIVDTQSTWQEPEVYSPIEYRNGALKITSKSPYRSEVNTEVISSKRMGDDGIETLRYLMRKYKQAAKKAGTDLYPEKEDLDEAVESEKYKGYVIEINSRNQANSPNTKFTYYNENDPDELVGTGSSLEDCKAQIDEKLGQDLDEVSENTNDIYSKPGLIVTGRTQVDNNAIGEVLDDLDLHGIWDVMEGCWFLPEEESTYDNLEEMLEQEFATRGINARFEGIFNSEDEADDISHPRGYEEASDAETEDDLYEGKQSLSELLK